MVAGASSIERIRIMLSLANERFNKSMDTTRRKMKQTGKSMNQFGSVMTMGLDNWRAANRAVRMTVPEFQKFTKSMPTSQLRDFNLRLSDTGNFTNTMTKQSISAAQAQQMMGKRIKTAGGKVGNATRDMTHGMRGFKMEMLGVMFFGMMLQQTFLGFLHPVMEAFGVFDLFRTMLLVVFLPIMEIIFPILLRLMQWFMDLPSKVKLLLGALVILGVIIGTLLFLIGSFALGIGSLILALPVIATLIPYIAAAIGAVMALGISFNILRDIPKAIKTITNWFKNLKPNIEKAGGAFNYFGDIVDKVMARIPIIGPIYKLLSKMWTVVRDFLTSDDKYAFLKNIFIGWFTKLKEDEGIIGSITRFVAKIWNTISTFIRKITTFGDDVMQMIKNTPDATWKDIGVYMAKKIFKGLQDYMKEAVLGIKTEQKMSVVESLNLLALKYGMKRFGFMGKEDDFVWRSGQGAVSINPNDTLVGFKGAAPNMGGGETTINNYYTGFTRDDLLRELEERDRKIVEDIQRMVKS